MEQTYTHKIPKIIHYCWFGGNPLPEMALHCIASWKKYCPDYEIIEWNESNFDLNYNAYVREAFEAKKWAFITDVVRLHVLTEYGGIYMDTDVEVLKSLDCLLNYEAVSGFESDTMIPTGLMACMKGQPLFLELLHEYDDIHFKNDDGTLDTTTNVTRITNTCNKYGFEANNTLQTVCGFTLLPNDYLCPKNPDTLETHITERTLTIHHFDGSWLSEEDKYRKQKRIEYEKRWGHKNAHRLSKLVAAVKFRGIAGAVAVMTGKVKKGFGKKAE